jgi:hypothetical protein
MGREEVGPVPRMSLALKGLYPNARSSDYGGPSSFSCAEKQMTLITLKRGRRREGGRTLIEKPGGGRRRVTFARDHDAFPFDVLFSGDRPRPAATRESIVPDALIHRC